MLAAFLLSATPDLTLNHLIGAPVAPKQPVSERLSLKSRDAEDALIRQAIGGNQLAYAALVQRYERMVYSLALQMVGNREDALEVTQDAFLKAFRFLASYRGESRFSTWLYRIARTSSINHLRRARRETVTLDAPESPVRKMMADAPDGFQTVTTAERTDMLLRAFDLLLPDDKTVLNLFYMKEQSLEEICEIMGWTMSNAKSRLCRARQRLRGVLVEHFSEEFGEWI